LDEAYLDVSFVGNYSKARNLALKIKRDILVKEGLTSTIGIGPNKIIAKIACNKIKPDGLLVIKPSEVQKFLAPLDIEELPGIGPKSAEKFREIKVNNLRELRKIPVKKLKEMFGKNGESFYWHCRGVDDSPVLADREVKSISKEETFEEDTRDPEIIFNVFEKLIADVWSQLHEQNFYYRNITVTCRFSGFITKTKSKTLAKKENNLGLLKKEAKNLLLKFLVGDLRPVRLLGLRCSVEK
jgi:DNA polymerase IV (DinB-like DNA polymerase)